MSTQYLVPESWADNAETYRFTPVVRVGNTVHISGATGGTSGDPSEQFEAAFAGVAEQLAEAGASWDDVVKMTTYHVGGLLTHLDAFRAVKDRYVKAPYPAWTGVGVSDLANPEAFVEIDVIAEAPS